MKKLILVAALSLSTTFAAHAGQWTSETETDEFTSKTSYDAGTSVSHPFGYIQFQVGCPLDQGYPNPRLWINSSYPRTRAALGSLRYKIDDGEPKAINIGTSGNLTAVVDGKKAIRALMDDITTGKQVLMRVEASGVSFKFTLMFGEGDVALIKEVMEKCGI